MEVGAWSWNWHWNRIGPLAASSNGGVRARAGASARPPFGWRAREHHRYFLPARPSAASYRRSHLPSRALAERRHGHHRLHWQPLASKRDEQSARLTHQTLSGGRVQRGGRQRARRPTKAPSVAAAAAATLAPSSRSRKRQQLRRPPQPARGARPARCGLAPSLHSGGSNWPNA